MFRFLTRLFAVLCAFSAAQAMAHPHAFVDMKTRFVIENDQFVALDLDWTYDAMSSAEMLYELKLLGNSDSARQTLSDDLMKNITAEHYFSYLYDENGQAVKFSAKTTNSRLSVENNQLRQQFRVNLAKPQPISTRTFDFSTYEASYYVGMTYAGAQDIAVSDARCTVKLIEPQVDQKLQAYMASLDKDDQAEERFDELSYGSIFAQKVRLECP